MRDRALVPADRRDLVDATALVAALLHELAPELVGAGAVVEVGRLPLVAAEPAALAATLRALLREAVRHRGSLRPRVRIRAERDADAWWLVVEDRGLAPAERGSPTDGLALRTVVRTAPHPDGGAIHRVPLPPPGSRAAA